MPSEQRLDLGKEPGQLHGLRIEIVAAGGQSLVTVVRHRMRGFRYEARGVVPAPFQDPGVARTACGVMSLDRDAMAHLRHELRTPLRSEEHTSELQSPCN